MPQRKRMPIRVPLTGADAEQMLRDVIEVEERAKVSAPRAQTHKQPPANVDALVVKADAPELNFKTIWSNYNRNKGTPTEASTRPAQNVTADEVARRLRH